MKDFMLHLMTGILIALIFFTLGISKGVDVTAKDCFVMHTFRIGEAQYTCERVK